MMRPRTYGPRSTTSTIALLPVLRFVTRAELPSGRVLLAAMFSFWRDAFPEAVRRPLNLDEYTDAPPFWMPRDAEATDADGAGLRCATCAAALALRTCCSLLWFLVTRASADTLKDAMTATVQAVRRVFLT